MFGKKAWLAFLGTLLTGGLAFAQGPGPTNPPAPSLYGNPSAPGYPGYGPQPYGAPAPMGPMSPLAPPPMPPRMGPPAFPYSYAPPMGPGGMMPNQPPGYPPPAVRPYDGNGPNPGANQPYMMLPDAMPPAVKPPSVTLPPLPGPPPVAPHDLYPPVRAVEFEYEPAPHIETGPPNEPYTLYEGRRYWSEVKLDGTCVWVQANYIHWWVRRDSPPPLVTTGPNPANLDSPSTTVLLGNGSVGASEFSGIQASAGLWLDVDRLQALEIGGFWVGKSSRQHQVASDANGFPLLAQPIQAPGETTLNIALPGFLSGSIAINSIMDFHGAELNFIQNICRLNGWAFDVFAGLRYLYLNDTLSLNQNTTVLPGGVVPFNGVGQGAGSNFQIADSFNATNRFYGGQIRARVNWTYCRFDFGTLMKLGLGATAHTVTIDGATTFTPPQGSSSTATGGSLAQASNIGQHGGTDFSIVPELTATVGYQLTCNLRVLAGGNILYWNRIVRAGDQIDRRIDLTQSPTGAGFVPGKVGTNPLFLNSRSEFWAMGLNLGLELKY